MTAESGRNAFFDSLQSITDGAGLYLVANLVVNGVKFLLAFVLARSLGAELYGLFTFGRKLATTLLSFASLGSDVATVRYLSSNREEPAYQNAVLGLSAVTAVVASIAMTAGFLALAPYLNELTLDNPQFTPVLQVFAVVVPFEALRRVATGCFRGLEMPREKMYVRIFMPVVRLAFIGVAVLLGTSVVGVAVGFTAGGVLALIFALSLVASKTDLRPSWGLDRGDVRGYYDYSLPLTFSRAGSILHKRIDIFMIGFFLAAADLAVYNVGMVLAGIVAIPLAGFNQFFPPVASRLYSNDDYETLESVYRLVTRWSITISVVVAAPIVVYRAELLALFGTEFAAGTTVVLLFVAGQLINAASGPSNDILQMTDHQYLVLVNHWGLASLNAVLNFFLIQSHGIVGAAIATASVLALTNVARVVQVWYFVDLVAYSRKLWKPLLSACAAVGVMVATKSTLSGPVLLVTGGFLGVVTYAGMLYAIGLERRDKEFVTEYVDDLLNDAAT